MVSNSDCAMSFGDDRVIIIVAFFWLLSISVSLFFIFGPCGKRKGEQKDRSVWGAPPF